MHIAPDTACNRPQGKSRVSPAPCELLTAARHRAAEISPGPNWPGITANHQMVVNSPFAVSVISPSNRVSLSLGYKSPSLFGTRIPKVPRYFGTHIYLLSICFRAEFSVLFCRSLSQSFFDIGASLLRIFHRNLFDHPHRLLIANWRVNIGDLHHRIRRLLRVSLRLHQWGIGTIVPSTR